MPCDTQRFYSLFSYFFCPYQIYCAEVNLFISYFLFIQFGIAIIFIGPSHHHNIVCQIVKWADEHIRPPKCQSLRRRNVLLQQLVQADCRYLLTQRGWSCVMRWGKLKNPSSPGQYYGQTFTTLRCCRLQSVLAGLWFDSKPWEALLQWEHVL